jgi:hypothetical protein
LLAAPIKLYQKSVLNKLTGKPSAENKFGMAVLVNPNLT